MPEETSAGETGRREALTPEREQQIRAMADPHGPYVEIPADNFETAHAIKKLLAEVERLRAELDAISTHTTQQLETWNTIGALTETELRERVAAAEGALEEMRGRMAGAREQWAVRYGNGDTAYVASETQARIKANVDLAIVAVVKRVVGEWEVVDGG